MKKIEAEKFINQYRDAVLKFELKSNHCIASIEWGLFDDNSNPLVKFDVSYCIKTINGEFKYICVIAHNENKRIEEYLWAKDSREKEMDVNS